MASLLVHFVLRIWASTKTNTAIPDPPCMKPSLTSMSSNQLYENICPSQPFSGGGHAASLVSLPWFLSLWLIFSFLFFPSFPLFGCSLLFVLLRSFIHPCCLQSCVSLISTFTVHLICSQHICKLKLNNKHSYCKIANNYLPHQIPAPSPSTSI